MIFLVFRRLKVTFFPPLYTWSNIIGIFRNSFQIGSDGYISIAVQTNCVTWYLTRCRFGISSLYLKLYINFVTDMNSILLGWLMGIVWLKKKGEISGALFSIFRLMKHLKSFWRISLWILHRKKWVLFSSLVLQEWHWRPVSVNLEVTFLK